MQVQRYLLTLGVGILIAVLGGCATTRRIDSQVSTHARWQAPAQASLMHYRFERLPSAQQDVSLNQLEHWAQTELLLRNWQHEVSKAQYIVQMDTRVQSYFADEWGQPLAGSPWWPHMYMGAWSRMGPGVHMGMRMRFPPSIVYLHELKVIIRHATTGQVVYETTARHNGPWGPDGALGQALVRSALEGFPQPSAPVRQVIVDLAP